MRKRIAQLALVAAMLLTGAVGLGSPAQAHDGNCESGDICLYYGGFYDGGIADFGGDIWSYVGYNFFGCTAFNCALNDNAASLWNHANYWDVTLCVDTYFRGGCIDVDPGTRLDVYDLGGWANELSSHMF